jgi:hypothetical protein
MERDKSDQNTSREIKVWRHRRRRGEMIRREMMGIGREREMMVHRMGREGREWRMRRDVP